MKWIQEKWTQSRDCPVCGSQDWGVNQIFQLEEDEGEGVISGAGIGIFPVVPVVCKECGYTFFVNAIRAGVVHPKKDTNDGKSNA